MELQEKKSLSPDLSLIGAGSVEECSIIDDELSDELRPLGFLASSGFLIFGAQEWNELTDAAQPIFTNVIPKDDDQEAD